LCSFCIRHPDRWRRADASANGDGPEPDGDKGSEDWISHGLIELAADPPEPPLIAGLLYPGERHSIFGPTESLKTWLLAICAKAEMELGLPVVWIDVDGMGPGKILERLQAIGCSDEMIHELFRYKRPRTALAGAALDSLVAEVVACGVRLVVVDSLDPLLLRNGLEPNSGSDIETFWSEVADRLTEVGAAVATLDHVAKATDNRDYAKGAVRKADGADVAIKMTLEGVPLTRGGTGKAKLARRKDRLAFHPPVIGTLVMESDGEKVSYRLERLEADTWQPTHQMQVVSEFLERGLASKNEIEESVSGKGAYLRTALHELFEGGYAAYSDEKRGGHPLIKSVRPYRDDGQKAVFDCPLSSSLSRGRTGDERDEVATSVVRPFVPPLQGDEDERSHRVRPTVKDELNEKMPSGGVTAGNETTPCVLPDDPPGSEPS